MVNTNDSNSDQFVRLVNRLVSLQKGESIIRNDFNNLLERPAALQIWTGILEPNTERIANNSILVSTL